MMAIQGVDSLTTSVCEHHWEVGRGRTVASVVARLTDWQNAELANIHVYTYTWCTCMYMYMYIHVHVFALNVVYTCIHFLVSYCIPSFLVYINTE